MNNYNNSRIIKNDRNKHEMNNSDYWGDELDIQESRNDDSNKIVEKTFNFDRRKIMMDD